MFGKITIYDLKYYPAAIKLDDNCPLSKVYHEPVSVFMNYEYSDEYLYEDDVAFDINDVVWGKVFIRVNNSLIKILDDETAPVLIYHGLNGVYISELKKWISYI